MLRRCKQWRLTPYYMSFINFLSVLQQLGGFGFLRFLQLTVVYSTDVYMASPYFFGSFSKFHLLNYLFHTPKHKFQYMTSHSKKNIGSYLVKILLCLLFDSVWEFFYMYYLIPFGSWYFSGSFGRTGRKSACSIPSYIYGLMILRTKYISIS